MEYTLTLITSLHSSTVDVMPAIGRELDPSLQGGESFLQSVQSILCAR